MLTLPPSLQITRNTKAERRLIDKTRTWLTSQERDPRIHASDLLDPRKSYWDRLHPQPLSDKLVGLFFVGKVLHAFFISALNGEKGTNWESDAGSAFDKTLKICWSNDWEDKTVTPHIPYEFKTSRSKYEQKKRDLWLYCEQLLIYMVAQKSPVGRLVVLQTNLQAAPGMGWGSYPQYRAYTVTVTKADLNKYRVQLIQTRELLEMALKTKKKKDIQMLPVCREFKCGKSQCPHYELCKPEGRYGTKRWDK